MYIAMLLTMATVMWLMMLPLWQMEKPHYEIIDDALTVADGKATM